ncbi:TonB-dependent receptor [Roseomonas sp. GC11]|uniref:TonB-dependent receptor plug domain-containing protein n=1 Tax=Roseomonas sp. GC11 TaxID=2950546 RepID=UPI00210B4FEF|nr:TonB-dependent receptor [Roseomonas sp. GC11]MCQ4158678.1 TonB-dependent receptor [Roseomonas sp. GC11]
MRGPAWIRAPAIALPLLLPGLAAAQGLDRAALEDLFGEPVTMSATGRPQRLSDVPLAMDIITAEQIRRSGARDLPGVLARYTSLDVNQYDTHDAAVGVRGYAIPNSPRLLVLLDGRQVYLDDYGRTVWHLIPVQLAEIRQIEIIKGPNSALYGFNAVAGVINILTYDPAYHPVNEATLRLGSGHGREVSGATSARLAQGGGIRLSAGIRKEDRWSRGETQLARFYAAEEEPSRYQIAGTASVALSDTVRFGLDASYSRSITSDYHLSGFFLPWDMRSWSLRARLSATTASGITEAALYHNGLGSSLVNTSGLHQGVTVAQLSHTMKPGPAHTLRPFVEYRYNQLSAGGSIHAPAHGYSDPGWRISAQIAAAGVMWNWDLTPGLSWTNAVRHDHFWLGGGGHDAPLFPYGATPYSDAAYDRQHGGSSWNSALLWKASEHDTFRVTIARGFGAPGLSDLGARASPAAGSAILGNPTLRPTTVDNYELGYRRSIAAIEGGAGLSLFYQMNNNLNASLASQVTMQPALGTYVLVPSNVGSAAAYGVEVSANGRLSAIQDWGLEYRMAVADNPPAPNMAGFGQASPRHILALRSGWTFEPVRIDGFLRYASMVSGYRATLRSLRSGAQADYEYMQVENTATLAARAAYPITPDLLLALEGSNLLTGHQRQGIGLEAERRIYLSLTAQF